MIFTKVRSLRIYSLISSKLMREKYVLFVCVCVCVCVGVCVCVCVSPTLPGH